MLTDTRKAHFKRLRGLGNRGADTVLFFFFRVAFSFKAHVLFCCSLCRLTTRIPKQAATSQGGWNTIVFEARKDGSIHTGSIGSKDKIINWWQEEGRRYIRYCVYPERKARCTCDPPETPFTNWQPRWNLTDQFADSSWMQQEQPGILLTR